MRRKRSWRQCGLLGLSLLLLLTVPTATYALERRTGNTITIGAD